MNFDRLDQQLFFNTVRIDAVTNDGQNSSGTGFIFEYREGERTSTGIVTNKHVVENMKEGAITCLKAQDNKPKMGEHCRISLSNWNKSWFGHPSPDVDIAVTPFTPIARFARETHNTELFVISVQAQHIPSDEKLAELGAIEDIAFVGYPNGIWDRKNFLPVARRGVTATPLQVDFEGSPKFLIDASVFGGSSGSPVYFLSEGPYREGNSIKIGPRFLLLGVIASVFYRTDRREVIEVPIPTTAKAVSEHIEMLDLGVVFKARTIVETFQAAIKATSAQPQPQETSQVVPPDPQS